MDVKKSVEEKNEPKDRPQASPSGSSHVTVATKEQLNEASSSEGSLKAPRDDNTATLSYILRTKAQLHEFEDRSQSSSLRPQVEDHIPDSWATAWARLRNEKREERIPDDCKAESGDESVPKIGVQHSSLSPQSQSVSSSEANNQQYSCPRQEGVAVNVGKPKDKNIYSYKLLQTGGYEHRLLVIHPGSSSDTIRVSIVHVLFSEKPIPEYEAISYVCGDVTKNLVTVKVIDKENGSDQGRLEIGQNLATALRHLRPADKPRTIWCDALCINQQVNDEKSEEILKMSDIYREAKRVVVWLGPEADNSRVALKTLSHLGNQVDMNWDWDAFGIKTPEGKDPQWSFANYPLPFNDATWRAIRKLIARTWFKRLWVWQEVTLADAETAIAVCGNDQILWDLLRRAVMCLYFNERDPTGMTETELRSYKSDLSLASKLLRSQTPTNIVGVLAFTRECQCTDAGDRVYAILSFQDEQRSLSAYMQPDYNKTKRQVYLDLMLAYRKQFPHSSNIFVFSGLGKGETPTWLPDWEVPKTQNPILQAWAAGRSPADFILLNENMAKVSAVYCGTITRSSKPLPLRCSRQEMVSTIRDWIPTNLETSTYPTGESSLDAFASMIAHNSLREWWPEIPFVPTLSEARRVILL